ncbi:MAG: ABC transporter ATP-binding protein [Chloroflexota bacterium]|nr:ABC transporter ATP-binding protein [Dehalococcoidia bacterium]MEC8959628.1 ABC transporter ATP-binding protein [Chloroflexota bacterium]MEE3247140.1 ABC transporter ATP-binding protein [Chloroflexota bacterium]MEE3248627.1 ABC transporter ATP-binding protein [Chloroflexota bacterium]|tara:strand:- start:45 stop:983 length:939 start_codon:yes stop_codon:yes gene_type:complete
MTQFNDYLAATRTAVPDSGLYIDCRDLFKIYKRADLEVVALRGLDLSVESGELIAVIGASGSGKSTLLNILAGLDRPSAGQVLVGTRDLLDVSDSDLVMYRRSEVGFVWQATARNLVPYLSVSDNIELPMALTGLSSKSRRAWSEELLESLGMIDKAKRLPYQLSGGEQQRAAIAVGLANKPPLLLADEPTGELDTENADAIFEMIRGLNRSYGVTVVTVTHYAGVSKFVDRVVHIRDGRIGSETFSRPDYRRDGGTVEEEYVVVDAAGRLQLPHDLAERFRRGGLAKIQSDDRQITIDPPGTNPRQPRSRS